MNLQVLILITLVTIAYSAVHEPLPETFYEWKKLEFDFPDDKTRADAEASGNFIPTKAIPIDVQPVYDDQHGLRTFVTIPKFSNGIPYSLATVSNKRGNDGPLLQPYPNYEMHQNRNGTNCDAITSVFRVVVNECNQMWVIDSGAQATRNQCPPQLLLFNLLTNELIHRFKFDDSLYIKDASLFVTPVVNVKDPAPAGKCQNTMVYISDVRFHGLVVYNYQQNKAWRIENMFMFPDPNEGLLTVNDKSFILMDGIFGMAADKKNLYFHPLASKSEFSVPLDVIDNSTLFANNKENMYKSFTKLGERKSPCTASAIDCRNNIYCVTLQPVELLKWNLNTPYIINYIKKLPIRPEELQFVSGLKVVKNEYGFEELWLLSNKFQNMATGTQNFEEINFRILGRLL